MNPDRCSGDTGLAGIERSVFVGVVVDVTAEVDRDRLGEVVVDAVFAAEQRDRADHIGAADLAPLDLVDRAGRGPDAEESLGLCLDHSIRSRRKVLELVMAAGVGDCRFGGSDVLSPLQLHERQLHARQARFARIPRVVQVQVLEHGAGDRGRQRVLSEREDGGRGSHGRGNRAGRNVIVGRKH